MSWYFHDDHLADATLGQNIYPHSTPPGLQKPLGPNSGRAQKTPYNALVAKRERAPGTVPVPSPRRGRHSRSLGRKPVDPCVTPRYKPPQGGDTPSRTKTFSTDDKRLVSAHGTVSQHSSTATGRGTNRKEWMQ